MERSRTDYGPVGDPYRHLGAVAVLVLLVGPRARHDHLDITGPHVIELGGDTRRHAAAHNLLRHA